MYKNILVPLDGSELAECVLPHVESIAKGCETQSVVFLRVVEPLPMPSGYDGATYFTKEDIKKATADARASAEKYLKDLVAKTNYNGVKIQPHLVVGIERKNVAEEVAEYATKNGIDLIVMSTHGRSGISRWAWGSVADRILRSACVPVLMVRAPGCIPGIS
jgi:nucleotide-binding universal stress UspA family protein